MVASAGKFQPLLRKVHAPIIKAADAKTITEQLLDHPNNLVKLAAKLATISMPAPSQGVGIAKESAAKPRREAAHDEWRNVLKHGA